VNAGHRLIVPAVLALGIAVASPLFWLWRDDGGAVDFAWTVGLALWLVMPFGLLLLFRTLGFSDVGTVVTAVVVAALTVLGYVAIESSESSTAGIALLFFPIYFAIVVLGALLIDLGVRHAVRRFANRKAKPS
jgi:hypothetical protein